MLALIEPLEADGTLVKRSRELLEAEIGNFLVVEHDGVIVGCAALYPFPEDKSAEFACLAVAAGLPRRGLRRAAAQGLRGAREVAQAAAPVRAHDARRALVSRAGLPRRRRPRRCPSSARRCITGGAARRYFSNAYNSGMARMVKCVKLGREAEGMEFPPYPGAARQAHLRERLQGSLGAVAEAPDHAGEREPAEPRRPARRAST